MWSFLGDTPVILASASPRRRAILENTGLRFTVRPVEVDESVPKDANPAFAVMEISERKAYAAAAGETQGWIIAADTIVVLGERIIGKPQDKPEASIILKALSGKTHTVITGFTIFNSRIRKAISAFDQTQVTFYRLSSAEIKNYIAAGEPMDKAGAYGIQEKGGLLVKSIRGDYFNVAGLPVAKLRRTWLSHYQELMKNVRHR